jgi:hypothetical protein
MLESNRTIDGPSLDAGILAAEVYRGCHDGSEQDEAFKFRRWRVKMGWASGINAFGFSHHTEVSGTPSTDTLVDTS